MRVHSFVSAAALLAGPVLAQAPAGASAAKPDVRPDTSRSDSAARRDTTRTLTRVMVTAPVVEEAKVTAMQRMTLPATLGITARKAELTVNVVDPEDAAKYLPSVFMRKRNYGDTQVTMGSRVWGTSSSARSMIYADGVPLTALIANNNTIGGPRWGLVTPEEIARIDLMYGPYSAAYAGNSMGAVMEITTRMPNKLEGSVSETQAVQHFTLYGTDDTFGTSQTQGTLGNRFGRFSFWTSGSYQNSFSQPVSYVTSGSFPTNTYGAYPETNKLGAKANVLGASGLLHTEETNAKVKLAYDFTKSLRATYTLGVWSNDASSGTESYLVRNQRSTFAGNAGFATGTYDLVQRHTAHNVTVRTSSKGDWDFEAAGSLYRMDRDQQRFPTTVTSADTFATAGRAAVLDGTGWYTADLKGAWHRGGPVSKHVVSFGVHQDQYALKNPTYATSQWTNGDFGDVFTEGDGKTRTGAVWAQDHWRIVPTLNLTVGGRWEKMHAFDGFNQNGATKVDQPEVDFTRFSPKAILAWQPKYEYTLTASVAKAYRFATAAELYQLISTGTTFTSPDPNLKPDNDLASELRAEGRWDRGFASVTLFQDDVHDAIISQFRPLVDGSSTLYSFVSNVDHVRARGTEIAGGASDLLVKGFELSGNVTYVDPKILAASGAGSATGKADAVIGKQIPNIPKWRYTLLGTYHPTDRYAFSLGGRYASKLYTTLDNSDVRFNTYQGFNQWFVMDAKADWNFDQRLTLGLGVDNLLNRKYFLFHPFPQRTVVGNVKVKI